MAANWEKPYNVGIPLGQSKQECPQNFRAFQGGAKIREKNVFGWVRKSRVPPSTRSMRSRPRLFRGHTDAKGLPTSHNPRIRTSFPAICPKSREDFGATFESTSKATAREPKEYPRLRGSQRLSRKVRGKLRSRCRKVGVVDGTMRDADKSRSKNDGGRKMPSKINRVPGTPRERESGEMFA
ncbi:hypothetical protein KM043_004224 [Ampulex compressa]|nr:hypothetical protein KM043_004224 [Ampulex compressa]